MTTVFVTGASGFVGRRVVSHLVANGCTVLALSRSGDAPAGEGIRCIRGDLMVADTWRAALQEADAVVHLAAAVGKASRAEFFRVNRDGTALLLREAGRAGIRRFVFTSSIAAAYADTKYYHYAHAKQAAEGIVRGGDVPWIIVRPTIVLGRGSAIGRRFRSLGAAPVLPVFGTGRVRVQPVDVDDLAIVLAELVNREDLTGRTLEIGGPDVVTMEELLAAVHVAIHGRRGKTLHVPLGALRSVLGTLERVSPALAPVTAGQFAAFCNDGVASNDALAIVPGHTFKDLAAMIGELVADV
jgi:uncharacterized protein YbjT (DUF2867 family)